MKRIESWLIGAGLTLCALTSAGAQQPTARDSAHAKVTRAAVDTIRRTYPATLKKSPTLARMVDRIAASESALVYVAPPPLPPVPVATFAVSCVGWTCAFDAGASVGTRLTYRWNCADVACPANGVSFSLIYTTTGTRTITLTVTDSLGRVATASRTATVAGLPVDTVVVVTKPDTMPRIAELPRSAPSASAPAPTRVVRVAAGGDLQAALNGAQPGDEIRLASGATWTGNYVIPATTSCSVSNWITLRSDVADTQLPAAGARITPSSSSILAKIVTTNGDAALRTAGPTCGWRLLGVELVAANDPSVLNYGIIRLGDGGWLGGGEIQTSLSKVPQDFILDRTYLHGTSTANVVRCVVLNSGRTAVINSWISECHAKGFDSQAIEGWNGPGPYLIENNFLSGAGENVMFGGADPGISGLSPSDITIRRNHVWKDPGWKGAWTVKNLLELKNARRVLIESNIFENNWVDGQSGMAIVIKSSQDACGTCTWQGTTDVTFRWNIVRNSPRGFNAQAVDCSGQACVDVHVQRVRVENNLFEQIGAEGDAWLVLLTHDLTDVALLNNTFLHALPSRGNAITMDYAAGAARRLEIRNNILTAGNVDNGSVIYSGGYYGTRALTQMAGSSWVFSGNAVVGAGSIASLFPPGNTFPASVPSTPGVDRAELAAKTTGVVVAVP